MAAKHTPGPWHRNIKPASKYPTVWAGRNTHVAAISPGAPRHSGNGCTMSEEEQEANINLIAAAPELYAAADEALNALIGCCIPAGGCDDRQHILNAQATLRSAIAKAETRS